MKARNKVNIKNPRLVPVYGDSSDAIQRELYGYFEFEDLDFKTKKEIIEELKLFYDDKDDLRKVLRKSVILGEEYGDHLSPEERYHALRDACASVNLCNSEAEAIEFVSDEMNSIVGRGNWWWEDGKYIRSILPKTDYFEPEEEPEEEEEEEETDED